MKTKNSASQERSYFLANVRDQVSLLASGATSCVSKNRERSPEGTGINCIALLAHF